MNVGLYPREVEDGLAPPALVVWCPPRLHPG